MKYTSSEYTSGEWKRCGTEVWAGSKRICFGRGSYDVADTEERNANLNLVAAAPAMYEALKELEGRMALPFRAIKALAKAEGKT